ncbi:MAG: shikimate kinase [Oligoflexales bacterium]
MVGMTGVGKSTVGEELAKLIGFGLWDIDKKIERAERRSIAQIFKEQGEDYFREQESAMIASIKGVLNHVVVVGAGALENRTNLEALERLGYMIWLQADVSEIVRRFIMKPDELRARPLLQDAVNIENKEERSAFLRSKIETFLERRKMFYAHAQEVLWTSYSTPESNAHLIKQRLISNAGVQLSDHSV